MPAPLRSPTDAPVKVMPSMVALASTVRIALPFGGEVVALMITGPSTAVSVMAFVIVVKSFKYVPAWICTTSRGLQR